MTINGIEFWVEGDVVKLRRLSDLGTVVQIPKIDFWDLIDTLHLSREAFRRSFLDGK